MATKQPIFVNSYQLLDLLGLIEHVDNGLVRLSNKALVLKDDVSIEGYPYSKVFELNRLFEVNKILNGNVFKKEELAAALEALPERYYLRVFFAKFRPLYDGRITQKADQWDSIKAWRYDIDLLKDEDFKKTGDEWEKVIKRANDRFQNIKSIIGKLPLRPNLIKKSIKGFHLIYVFDKPITREAYDTYLRLYNKPSGNKPDDDITDQFIVFELLRKYIPKYLLELDPTLELDVQASSVISSIATRLDTKELVCQLLHAPYTFKEFRKAFEFLLLDNTTDVVYKEGKTPYTIRDIPKTTFLSLIDRCSVLKALDEDWENHSEYEWYVMINYYAIKILYAETQEEAEQLRKEFHDKSSRWHGNGNKHYTYNEAERQLQYYIRKQEEGLKPPTCKYIYNNLSSKYTTICHSCPYRKFDHAGRMISNFIFDGLKNNSSLEDITIPGWELRDDGWYMEIRDNKDELNSPPIWIRVLPYFRIRTYYLVGGANFTELIDVVDRQGISTIHVLERRKDTLKVNPADIVVPYGKVATNWDRAIKTFLTDYIEAVKEKRGVKVSFLGYKYVNGSWNIAIGGYCNYRRNDLGFIFYGDVMSKRRFIPSVQGRLEVFKDVYSEVFKLNDPAVHLSVAHYLSWIGEQFLDDESLQLSLNPFLIFIGDSGTGKSARAKIAAAMYGNPALFSFTNVSQASYNNRFPMLKAPFGIDEVSNTLPKYEEKLSELLYNIGNRYGKTTAYGSYQELEVPVILIGETQKFLVDKMFKTDRGLARRSIVIKITQALRQNAEVLNQLINKKLSKNYGHIITYALSLNGDDRDMIDQFKQDIFNKLKLGNNNFYEIKEHLALSLAMFKHFYMQFIGLSEDETDEKINKVIEFLTKEIAEHQLTRIGDTVDYVQEVLEFISAVLKAQKRDGITFRGYTYKGLIDVIDYKPTDKIERLLKKFFWKVHKYTRSTDYRFRDTSILLTYPNTHPKHLAEEAEKIYNEFTEEEVAIWLKVAELRFGDESLDYIKQGLASQSGIGEKLIKKFSVLKPTREVSLIELEEAGIRF